MPGRTATRGTTWRARSASFVAHSSAGSSTPGRYETSRSPVLGVRPENVGTVGREIA